MAVIVHCFCLRDTELQRSMITYIQNTPSFHFLFLFLFLSFILSFFLSFFPPSLPSFLFSFFVPYPWHMELHRLGIQLELQLLACATATAIRDLSHVCNLHHSSQQCRTLSPLSKARAQTCILVDTSWVR